MIEIQILKAIALQAQGDILQAMTALKQALTLAEPEGHIRLFLDEGEPMARLLRYALSRRIAPGYAGKLLAVFKAEEARMSPLEIYASESIEVDARATTPPHSHNLLFVEPPSEREIEVLRLIAAGLSNREIAERLVVAVSTIKTHINHLYHKLDVSRRVQAVTRARELNLI